MVSKLVTVIAKKVGGCYKNILMRKPVAERQVIKYEMTITILGVLKNKFRKAKSLDVAFFYFEM